MVHFLIATDCSASAIDALNGALPALATTTTVTTTIVTTTTLCEPYTKWECTFKGCETQLIAATYDECKAAVSAIDCTNSEGVKLTQQQTKLAYAFSMYQPKKYNAVA